MVACATRARPTLTAGFVTNGHAVVHVSARRCHWTGSRLTNRSIQFENPYLRMCQGDLCHIINNLKIWRWSLPQKSRSIQSIWRLIIIPRVQNWLTVAFKRQIIEFLVVLSIASITSFPAKCRRDGTQTSIPDESFVNNQDTPSQSYIW